MQQGFFTVSNTESRKTELCSKIDAVINDDILHVADATSLRSRLLFADAQVFGRFAKAALHEVGKVGLASHDMKPLTPSVKSSLLWLRDHVLSGPPRRIDFQDTETYYLFLDGACTDVNPGDDWGGTSIGGVLVFPDGSVGECFGEILPPEWMKHWGKVEQQQYIFEAEIMPYAVALFPWRKFLNGKCLFAFIGNEGARSSWITGFASTKTAQHILHIGTTIEAKMAVHPYFARVPTHSNLGDAPSRGKFSIIEKFGGRRVAVPMDLLKHLMKHATVDRGSHSNASGAKWAGLERSPYFCRKKGVAPFSEFHV